ncbi:hypothetical protein [Bacillus sp. OAE603]|uniref:hypothetical protein n=1 Tax=Gottfriedia sp. OAE603 TaxID=2663872 RepID=UPI00178ADF97
MEQGVGVEYSSTLLEIVGFWLIIILVIYFLIKGIRKGNAQKRDQKINELEKRLERLEKLLDKE